jgi:hypothetical protein
MGASRFIEMRCFKSLLQKSWHGHLAREKRPFSWQIPVMNHGQDARATLFASPSTEMAARRI